MFEVGNLLIGSLIFYFKGFYAVQLLEELVEEHLIRDKGNIVIVGIELNE